MTIQELLHRDFFEDKQNETKLRLDEKDPSSWLKTVAAFANCNGGTLYIGVNDSGVLAGFSKEELDHVVLYFSSQVSQHISPRPFYQCTYLKYGDEESVRYVVAIEVRPSASKPVYFTFKGAQSVFLREQGFVRLASREEIGAMYMNAENVPFDMQRSEIKYDPNDFKKLFQRYKENTGKELTEKALASIGFFDEERYLRLGALFFKDDYQDDRLMVKACQWMGLNRSGDIVLHPETWNCNFLDEADRCMDFILSHSVDGFKKEPSSRSPVFSYPKRSIFEAVINALAHRNYYLYGSFVQIDLFPDRLEISSPGALPGIREEEKIYDISSIRPQSRNPLIAKIFQLLKMMEALGTGFDKITSDYSGKGETHRPFACNAHGVFTLTLPDLFFQNGVVGEETLPAIAHGVITDSSSYDDRILSYCYARSRAASDIASFLGVTLSTHLRKDILGNLVKQGYLETHKKGKGLQYQSNQNKVFPI